MKPYQLTDWDRDFYDKRLRHFLPTRIIDCHAHVWTADHFLPEGTYIPSRSAAWAARAADINPVEQLLETYAELFTGKTVVPVLLPGIETHLDGQRNNEYVAASARTHGFPSLALTKPTMTAAEFEDTIDAGRFVGCKPYLNFAAPYIPKDEIRIFDFLPREHLEVLDRRGWAAMLHIARPGRLGDPMNLAHLQQIDEDYPRARVIVTHIGRAYADSDVGQGMEAMAATKNLTFDITANTNSSVMERLIEAVGVDRIMFGSDLPIFAMRASRIIENDHYVNVVPRGRYGDVSGDSTMRETDDFSAMTLLLYEEIEAFARAAAAMGVSEAGVQRVFYDNAAALFRLES